LGREAIIELLDVDSTVREIIYEGSVTELNRYLDSIAYASFRAAAVEKVLTGLTTVEEIKRVLPHSTLMMKGKRKPPAPRRAIAPNLHAPNPHAPNLHAC